MYDCVYNPKYSVHNSLSGKISLHLCVIYFYLFFLILPYYTVLAINNLFH